MLAIVVPFGVYAAHASLVGSWVVDDAGITFAYARSLAEGHGLVSQPGAPPVEGFTNILWVAILAIPIKLRIFDPVATPKVIAAVCVALSFVLMARTLAVSDDRPLWLSPCALSISAAMTGFAIWCASGLENALYVLVVALLAWHVSREAPTGADRTRATIVATRNRAAALAGVLMFLVFCTRPDGALYFWIPAFVLGLEPASVRTRRPLVTYVAAFTVPWLALTAFRLVYFRDVLPNTFYAKKGEGSQAFAWLLEHLPLAFAGLAVALIGLAAIAGVAWGCHALARRVRGRVSPAFAHRIIVVPFFVTAILAYHALRGDWMPEYRYATPAFLFGPAAVLVVAWELGRRHRVGRVVVTVAALAAVVWMGVSGWRRTTALGPAPALAFAAVRATAVRLSETTQTLGPDVSVLVPDVGGALWESRFRVVDLVGLIDPALGREVGRSRQAIHDYLLHELRPDAIYVHGRWGHVAGLDLDDAFTTSYMPAWEERSTPDAPPTRGLYVRRDLRRGRW